MSNRLAVWVFLTGFIMALPAFSADKSTHLNTYQDWAAYTFMEQGQKVCYITSQPKKDEGKYKKRGDIYAFVTHRPGDKQHNVVSILTGYTYKKNSEVQLIIDGGQPFTLSTVEERAWAENEETDNAIINALKKGEKMVIKGTSSRGTATVDTYSLQGFTRALYEIDQTCAKGK